MVREQKSQFIILRSKFATRAYECIKARFYNKAEVLREAHATDSHSSHALGDRSALYSASMANVSALPKEQLQNLIFQEMLHFHPEMIAVNWGACAPSPT